MTLLTAFFLLPAAYLIGAIPFGYLVGRMRGVDLFLAGSGNIGATNAGRVLGAEFGILVFILDFLKGAIPVAAAAPLARLLGHELDNPELLRVLCAATAFLGHLFPIYLRFQGGKGVATGAGTIAVLVPAPAALAILTWVVVLLASRVVSLASLAAVGMLVLSWLASAPAPYSHASLPVTLYLIVGTLIVAVKHRENIRRLAAGTENRIGDFPMREPLLRAIHILALGLWFGGAAFFNFVAAVPIFDSFKQVVHNGPSDRTAHRTIIAPDASAEEKDALANALAGAAVGPIFPRYFALQAVCGVAAFLTAATWAKRPGRANRLRLALVGAALLTVAVGWPISDRVSELRLKRFDPADSVREAAKAAFATWHLVSLLLAFITTCLAGAALALASALPQSEPRSPEPPSPEPLSPDPFSSEPPVMEEPATES